MKDRINRYKQFNLNNEKLQRIIHFGFEEFSKNDFTKASTNQIVQKADVSRGLLYHYFKDKEDLYDFLIFYSIKISVEEIEEKINWEETDFLNRIQQAISVKLSWLEKYPYLFSFYNTLNRSKMIKTKKNMRFQIDHFREKFYNDHLDFSFLKPGVNKDMVIQLTRFTIKQLTQDYLDQCLYQGMVFQKDSIMKEIQAYLKWFRCIFYQSRS